MHHDTPLIATIVAGISLAFVFGAVAHRLRFSPLVGYLVAGVAVGPFTPGYVADQSLAPELAEIGVILLMFGVGLHFSLKDLLSVRAIAIPGAVVQIAVATLLGWGLAHIEGWPAAGGLVFGLALSVASTVVLLRALQERRLVQTDRGRIAVGWLIVEDLAMVLALVLLPPIGAILSAATDDSGAAVSAFQVRDLLLALALTLAKVTAFVVIMLVFGRRVIPWILHYTAHTGSRELFRLGVLAIGLGVAYGAAQLFDVSEPFPARRAMPEERAVEVFYNSACPVCDAGIKEQRRALAKAEGAPVFTDMTCSPNALASEGLTLDHVRRHIYARDTEGKLHRGADAIALLWRSTPRRRWLGRVISLPGLRTVARVSYDWFADRLYAWNRRHGRW